MSIGVFGALQTVFGPRISSKTRQLLFGGRHFLPIALVALACAALGRAPLAQAAGPEYSAIVIDADTGQVLRSDNARALRYPASLTKMMTLYITFDAIRYGKLSLDQELPVSAHAQSQHPTKIGVRAGQRLKVRDAILALVTQSANDAAVVLAEGQAGSETAFARQMTAQAHALGMVNTTYRNASGLPDPGQVTTAADYALLSRALMRDFPEDYRYFSTRQFAWGGRTFGNHNHLLEKYDGADGIKTGFINASGFNLAASAQRNGRRLIAVMFGGHSAAARDRQVMALLDSGFEDLGVSQNVVVARDATRPAVGNPLVHVVAARTGQSRFAARRHGLGSLVHNAVVSPAEAAEAPAETERSGAWGIQVGAFARKTLAQKHAARAFKQAPRSLGPARREISRVRTSHAGAVYRVRFIGLSERAARNACSKLKPAKIGCVPVSPGQQVASR